MALVAAPSGWKWAILVAGAIVVLAVAAVTLWNLWQPPAVVKHLTVSLPSHYDSETSGAATMALSPNGRDLVYLGLEGDSNRIYHRPLHQAEAAALPGTEGNYI